MPSLRAWVRRLAGLLGRARRDDEFAAELDAHLQAHIDDNVRAGMRPDDARRRALVLFGGVRQATESWQDRRGVPAIETCLRDSHYALRTLRKNVGFASVSILTLALGLGATIAMFSIVNGALLAPLNYREPERLYLGRTTATAFLATASSSPINERIFYAWRTRCQSCEQVALIGGLGFTLTGSGEPERLPGLQVSYNFFKTLGVPPRLGRDFLPDEELPGRERVVLLSDGFWRSHFGGDPSIVGRQIVLNGESHDVIGVMPADLHLPKGEQWGPLFAHDRVPLIFRPLGIDVAANHGTGSFNYTSLIRLRSGVTARQGIDDMNADIPDVSKAMQLDRFRAVLIPLQDQVTAGARALLWLLLGAVCAVLLIVCVNVGNLMLVRTASRQREASIRLALGASRAGLFSLVLHEAALVVLAGAALGIALAYGALKFLVLAAPVDLPRIDEVQVDWRALVFTAMVATAAMLICGLVPAWRLATTHPQESLKAGSSQTTDSGRKRRFSQALVGLEVALSALLLVVGGLLIVSFVRLMQVDKGFQADHVMTQGISLVHPRFRDAGARTRFIDDVLFKLKSVPGVRAAGVTNQVPLHGETWIDALASDSGQPENLRQTANFRFVSPDYWSAMGIALERGRFINESDRHRGVAVLGHKAARVLWPDADPIGKHIRGAGPRKPLLEVIGVVADVREAALTKNPPAMVYEPYWAIEVGGPSFVVRTDGPLDAVANATRAIVHAVDPEVPLTAIQTMTQVVDDSTAVRRFQVYVAAAFALSALILASLGIYGVVSFTVARRTPELGVRIALGAPNAQLMGMVLRQGMQPVLAGLAAGLTVALVGGRVVASQLYGVAPNDPLTIVSVGALLMLVAFCACWVPARRATRIDPLRALRAE